MSTGVPNLGSSPPSADASSERPASQVRGHAKYVKGVVDETIGQVAGAPSWIESGHESKAQGVAEMRAAKSEKDKDLRESYAHRDPDWLKSEGKQEALLGRTVGCGGMEERGEEKVQTGERMKRDSV
ncbi:hypothetical protein FN846DRAFT_912535 [Sphaerosporella brunnea]|uniref:CsbD-like domain-containing protein n=1 Tax=Sphaerosporella brunnea TaxID=1250544 RepID=A0A5J5EGD9_9PEZI|nr:hypothetical protein FN846DRAFT_912535 [Sphaerosporella brunnea]